MKRAAKLIPGIMISGLVFLAAPAQGAMPSKQAVVDAMVLVNDYWISRHANPGNNEWSRASYFEGNMALYAVYPDPKYYDYALGWAAQNGWDLTLENGAVGVTQFADNQCAGQTYIELYAYDPQAYKIERIRESIDSVVENPPLNVNDHCGLIDDYYFAWSWIDLMQMAMPLYARLGRIYGDPSYYETLWDLYRHIKYECGGQGLYSDNGNYAYGDYLWWRDFRFDPLLDGSGNESLYWSRGNGWVVAAHVRTLEHLPQTEPHYFDEYLQTLLEMSASLKDRQLASGFWPVNLGDPTYAQGLDPIGTDAPETSGTAFFTYALAWGVNRGYLDWATYAPVVEKAWNALVSTAIHPDGKVGWVQGPGAQPKSSQPITYESTADFGVGAVLLAGSQVMKMAPGPLPVPPGAYASAATFTAVHSLGSGNTGQVVAEFDVAPQRDSIDAVVCFADSSVTIGAYSSCAMLVRMFTNGVFDVRDGATYRTDAVVAYEAMQTYHVRLVADFDTRTYDVYVRPPAGAEVRIANDYAFRSNAPATDDLGQVCLKSLATDDFTLRALDVYAGAPSSNLALGKVSAWSSQQTGNYASDACDGSALPEDRWSAQGFPQWLEIDLGSDRTITKVSLFPYQDRAYQYRVELKPAGGVYSTVVDRESNTEGGPLLEDTFANQTGRFVRLTVTGADGYGGNWVSLRELEVWGY